jgi:hypothetical protein
MSRDAEYITDKEILDPESGNYVSLEIWRDPFTGKLFGIDGDHVSKISTQSSPGEVSSLYHAGDKILLRSL